MLPDKENPSHIHTSLKHKQIYYKNTDRKQASASNIPFNTKEN